jgi:hypothetical protein
VDILYRRRWEIVNIIGHREEVKWWKTSVLPDIEPSPEFLGDKA